MRTSTVSTPFPSRWSGRCFSNVAWRGCVVFSRRDANRLCAERSLANVLEALSRWADNADLYRTVERPGAGNSSQGEFERQASGLVRRLRLLPLRPQRGGNAI